MNNSVVIHACSSGIREKETKMRLGIREQGVVGTWTQNRPVNREGEMKQLKGRVVEWERKKQGEVESVPPPTTLGQSVRLPHREVEPTDSPRFLVLV